MKIQSAVVAVTLSLTLFSSSRIAQAGPGVPLYNSRRGSGLVGSPETVAAGTDTGIAADRRPSQILTPPPAGGTSALENARVGDLIRLSGKLKCDLGNANTGEPCQLLFSDVGTGRTFQLTAETKAMKLYFDDNREVVLDGRLMGAETLEVVDVRKQ